MGGALAYQGSERFPGGDVQLFKLRVSPDGTRVYAFEYRGVTSFRRQANGSLDYLGCLKLEKSVCASSPRYPFTAEAAGVAVSPDSRFLYVVSGGTNYMAKGQGLGTVSVLARTDGAPGLRQVRFLKLPVWGVDNREGKSSMVIPPDGRYVYLTAKDQLRHAHPQ